MTINWVTRMRIRCSHLYTRQDFSYQVLSL